MTGFIAAALLAVAATLLLLLRPLFLRRSAPATASHRLLNAAIHRDQLAELERDRGEGTLGEEDYQQARMELQRRVLEDGVPDDVPAAPRASKPTLWAIGIALPLAAFLFYFLLGNPAALNAVAAAQQHRFSSQEIERMVAGLAARLEQEPDNLQGWAMLGRSYKAMGRLDEAEKAFGHAQKLVETDAQLLADYADVLAAQAGGNFAGKPAALIEKALKLDPANPQALWLAGSVAFDDGRFDRAVTLWEHLIKLLPPESEDAKQLAAGIVEARARSQDAKK